MNSESQLSRLSHAPRILVALATTLALLFLLAGAAQADGAAGSSYLVSFAAGTSEADQAAALADAGVTDVSEVRRSGSTP
jgi:hypothetical protein